MINHKSAHSPKKEHCFLYLIVQIYIRYKIFQGIYHERLKKFSARRFMLCIRLLQRLLYSKRQKPESAGRHADHPPKAKHPRHRMKRRIVYLSLLLPCVRRLSFAPGVLSSLPGLRSCMMPSRSRA